MMTLLHHTENFLKTLFIVSDAFITDEGSLGANSPAWVHSDTVSIPGAFLCDHSVFLLLTTMQAPTTILLYVLDLRHCINAPDVGPSIVQRITFCVNVVMMLLEVTIATPRR